MKRLVSLIMAGLILTACGSLPIQISTLAPTGVPENTAEITVPGADLVNTQWTLDSISDAGVEPTSLSTVPPYLEFRENGEAGGSGGCNTFSTQYEVLHGELSFGPIASTKIACETEGVMQQEQSYFDALESTNRYEVSGDTLRIWNSSGQNTLTFLKTTVNTPTALLPTTIASVTVAPPATSTGSGNGTTAQRIVFPPDATSVTITGALAASESDQYVLRALAGQTMSLNLTFTEGQAILVVWGEDGDVLLSDHAEVSTFERELPKTQDYHIQVKGRPDGNTAYTMTVSIPPITTGVERITFAAGSTSATVTGQLEAYGSHQYVLAAQAGQTLNINMSFSEGAAILVIWGADGDVLMSDHAEASTFQGVLRTTQDYYILLKGSPDGSTSYTMTVTIPPPS